MVIPHDRSPHPAGGQDGHFVQELLDAFGMDQRLLQLLEILGKISAGFSHRVTSTHGEQVKRLRTFAPTGISGQDYCRD